ncbi:MAG TPA: hypothetical protein DIT01_16780 [Lentisphaeria bacterium]|nr:hypothetical protein [Lentisphaeria bacterium]|tara:strand:+ start:3797 stop:6268 length:2472 start_codon:yes stop_codon:yes gene_type:complete
MQLFSQHVCSGVLTPAALRNPKHQANGISLRPRPINDAESVIEAFWDPTLSELDTYTFEPVDGTGAAASQNWCWVDFSWHDSMPGTPIFTMWRDVDISLTGYDAMRIRCALPGSVVVTLAATIDGSEQTVLERVRGQDKKWEFTGPITGQTLQRIRFTCDAIDGGIGSATVQYINLVNLQIERIRQSRPPAYTADWPEFLLPADRPIDARPSIGLLFDEPELESIRTKARHPGFRWMIERICTQAHSYIGSEPEQFIMTSGATTNRHHRAHEIERGESDPANIVVTCGFVGLLENDPQLLRLAARAMLSIAHAEYWDECFQEHFPGSTFSHRAFSAFDNCYALALGLDWAGAALTDAGRKIVMDAISKKGLTLINRDFLECEYIYHCNQAACFAQGRIAALLALRSTFPRADSWLDQAEGELLESIDLVFNATDDHGGHEGPGYTSATIVRALYALVMLARYRGKSLAEMTPRAMIGCTDFCFMFLSTVESAGEILPYGDSAGTYGLDLAALMSVACDDPRWERLRQAMLHEQAIPYASGNATVDGLHTLILTDPPTADGAVDLPHFCLLPSTGIVASCRPTAHGPVRCQLFGAAAGGGHLHQDKGSFILEIFHEAVCIDRGKLGGSHPGERVLVEAHMHNVLSPAKTGDRHEAQHMHPHQPILPTGHGDETIFDASIDTTSVWIGLPFRKHIRRIYSPEPSLFFVDDAVSFEHARGATFHLHTRLPIKSDDGRFVIGGGQADLIVTPAWDVSAAEHGPDFIDGNERPVNHLAMTSVPGTDYRLVTVLEVVPAGTASTWTIDCSQHEVIVARRGECEHRYRTE